ncbi:hypothetical protein ACOZ38_22830 [Sphaerisporangium viridialbum]|uniref:hypothetical protein n=1 Tax=Sphaerisporangium viridialbum TaxID=46189 RepID=UPI003C7103D6
MSRAPGRHAPGLQPGQVIPRRWDLAKKAAAAQLDQMEPAWHIFYGVGSRRFYAIALWSCESPMVYAHTAEELREVMRDVEFDAMAPFRLSVRAA